MTDGLLYLAVVVIWGTTWIMIKFQLGVVPPEVSVAYRFAIAAALMFAEQRLRATASTRIESISLVNDVTIDGLPVADLETPATSYGPSARKVTLA